MTRAHSLRTDVRQIKMRMRIPSTQAEAYTYGYLQVWRSSVLYPRPRGRELSESGLSISPGTEGLENNQE